MWIKQPESKLMVYLRQVMKKSRLAIATSLMFVLLSMGHVAKASSSSTTSRAPIVSSKMYVNEKRVGSLERKAIASIETVGSKIEKAVETKPNRPLSVGTERSDDFLQLYSYPDHYIFQK
jgi:hypothetical protein